jgi:tetratricopeptide (TPR) repeat protein
MNRRASYGLLLGAVLVAGFVCVWKLQKKVDAERAALRLESEELTFRSPAVLKKLSLEYAPLMGAIYWTRVVQYFGAKHHAGDQNLDQLWPLLDITTSLDSNLLVAYRFGAMFLSDSPPRGAGDPDHAVELLQRGMKANPEYWKLYQDLGNVYYFDKRDYLKAAQAYEAGSKFPGTPPFMKAMAAKIAAEGGSLETSHALWLDIYQTSTNKEMRKNAEDHLRLVQAEMDIREIDKIADTYEKGTKHRAMRISELVQAGLLPGQPRDPDGFAYVLNDQGRAEPNPKSPLREEWLREMKR